MGKKKQKIVFSELVEAWKKHEKSENVEGDLFELLFTLEPSFSKLLVEVTQNTKKTSQFIKDEQIESL